MHRSINQLIVSTVMLNMHGITEVKNHYAYLNRMKMHIYAALFIFPFIYTQLKSL